MDRLELFNLLRAAAPKMDWNKPITWNDIIDAVKISFSIDVHDKDIRLKVIQAAGKGFTHITLTSTTDGLTEEMTILEAQERLGIKS